jgi:hypothetical protein
MSDWRYFAQRFDGDGNLGEFVDMALPLVDVEIEEVLSGVNGLTARIPVEYSRLQGPDGRPVFDEWGACIWAESPNGEVFGGILEKSGLIGSEWRIECIDLPGVMIEMPFDDAVYFVDVDPIDVFRYLWQWYQSRPGCNLGIGSDMTKSAVLLGANYVQIEDFDQEGGDPAASLEPAALSPSSYANNQEWLDKAVKKLFALKNGWTKAKIRSALEEWLGGGNYFESSLEAKIVKKAVKILGNPPSPPGTPLDATPSIVTDPKTYQKDAYKLNWYTNQDLSQVIDELASGTPFDWHMKHYWSDEGDEADLFHHFRLGYPKLGRRLEEFRFVVGENIHTVPDIERDGEEYANEIIVLGNGEGAATVRGRAYRAHPGKMRRTKVITDQTLMTSADCNRAAEAELATRFQLEDIAEVEVLDHPNAPFGSVQLGDEFLLEGDVGWGDISVWVRCVGRRFSPDSSSVMGLSLIRTDRLS